MVGFWTARQNKTSNLQASPWVFRKFVDNFYNDCLNNHRNNLAISYFVQNLPSNSPTFPEDHRNLDICAEITLRQKDIFHVVTED